MSGKVSAGDYDAPNILRWIEADFRAKSRTASIRRGRVDTGTFGPQQTLVITMRNGQRFRIDVCEMYDGGVR